MTGSAHLSTWIDAETKQRFASAAARQGLSESALLKRLVDQMLATGSREEIASVVPVDLRDARVTVRLVPQPINSPECPRIPQKHLTPESLKK
jgi:hypothetical protein